MTWLARGRAAEVPPDNTVAVGYAAFVCARFHVLPVTVPVTWFSAVLAADVGSALLDRRIDAMRERLRVERGIVIVPVRSGWTVQR